VFARLPDPDKPQIEQRPCRCSINGNCLMAAEQVDKVKMLTDWISPILHGHNPEIQGAVLAARAFRRIVSSLKSSWTLLESVKTVGRTIFYRVKAEPLDAR
jgi:hypothetical protein